MTIIRLRDGEASATVAELGAELRSWDVGPTPLLWTPEPAIWADVAPLLFPVVGWTRGASIAVDGRRYPLGLHGFARTSSFEVVHQTRARVTLRLAASADTRALYPFDWTLEVTYALSGASLSVRLSLRNDGVRAMPYAVGLHPGFRWPFAGGAPDDYRVEFAAAEEPHVPVISPDGLFTRHSREVPLQGRCLPLSAALLADEALCFLDARSTSVRFAHRSDAAITLALEDFPHIALWSRPKGCFLCLEAWTGHGDFVDADGDLTTKPSTRHLPPATSACHAAKFSFDAG